MSTPVNGKQIPGFSELHCQFCRLPVGSDSREQHYITEQHQQAVRAWDEAHQQPARHEHHVWLKVACGCGSR